MKPLHSIALAAAICTGSTLLAQTATFRVLPWSDQPVRTTSDTEKGGIRSKAGGPVEAVTKGEHLNKEVFFDMERGGLPLWMPPVVVPPGTTSFNVTLEDAVYEEVPASLLKRFPALSKANDRQEIRTHVGIQRKETVATVVIDPYRRDPATGRVERLISARVNVVDVVRGGDFRPKSYPAASKLASGSWYRMSVGTDGVHRVTYAMLDQLGVDVDGLASDRINLYGNHTGMLPFRNDQLPPTDLRVNAIEVQDGGDGIFGPGDQLLFYASGPQRWTNDGVRFQHIKNVFCDSSHYFIGIDVEPPVRVAQASLSNDTPDQLVTTFNERMFIERDLINLLKSGRTWFGEVFDQTLTYSYPFTVPNIVTTDSAFIRVVGAARTIGSQNASTVVLDLASVLNQSFPVNGVSENYTGVYGQNFDRRFGFLPVGSPLTFNVTFNKFNPVTSVAWMDHLELNCRRQLRMSGDQLLFRDLRSVGPGVVSEFVLEQAQNVQRIWEITDPAQARRVDATADGNTLRFRLNTDSLRQFVAFRNSGFLEPTPIGPVPNQNLHGTPIGMDLTIVCPPEFQGAAARLVERRQSEGLDVVLVTPQQIYNEFSSGTRDATAIKRYMRMQYERASTPEEAPRYLLLFGDGSYNNVLLTEANQNWIPTYQTTNVLDPGKSYGTDDYYGFLDPNEGEWTGDLVDLGIGRLPVSSADQANSVVNKILNYDQMQNLGATGSSCTASGDGGLVDWRTHVLFASDDQEGENFENTIHLGQSETLAQRVVNEHPTLNVDKVYLDAYQQITTPGGERYPQANTDLREAVEKGLLLVNYIGHGGEVGWAHERFLDNSTILGWTNGVRLPLFMTATCEFTRWDDPSRTSAGEYVLLNPDGGGIGLMTTSRLAYSI
ncbi:MAG: type IX secretion system sortase PorU, partial [Flavobacteriales bacterium]